MDVVCSRYLWLQLVLSEYDSVAMALSQLDDWHTAAVPLVTLIESLPHHRLDVIEAFLASTQQGITRIISVSSLDTDRGIIGFIRSKNWPALASTEYQLMPSACRLTVRAYQLLPYHCQ